MKPSGKSSIRNPVRVGRAIFATILALALAILLFLQAGSSVLVRKNPAMAVQLNPYNGLALEQLAARNFTINVSEQKDILPVATAESGLAMRAFQREALVPKAHSIIAIARDDTAARQSVLAAAVATNKRDLFLQGLVLEDQLSQDKYTAALDTLDTILRVHPEQQENFFPVLLKALARDDTVPAFRDILSRETADWRESFLNIASANEAALPNLAKLRLEQTGKIASTTDQRIISGLFTMGRFDQSWAVYRSATSTAKGKNNRLGKLTWQNSFPPFDWTYADQGDFRAQPSVDGESLELFARSGNGGIIAERAIEAPKSKFTVRIVSDLGQQDTQSEVRLKLSCAGKTTSFLDVPIPQGSGPIQAAAPNLCKYVMLSIYARAWSGGTTIRGKIDSISISTP